MRDYLHAHIQKAFSDDWTFLRSIPSSTVWRTLSYYASLPPDEQTAAVDQFADAADETLSVAMGLRQSSHAAVGAEADKTPRARIFQAVHSQLHWSEFPDRFLQQYAANPENLHFMVAENRIEAICVAQPPKLATAGAIRKYLRPKLKSEFGASASNLGGGRWSYQCQHDGHDFLLNLDFGGKLPGFSYGVAFPNASGKTSVDGGLTLECVTGLPTANWDFLLSDELESFAATLFRVIREVLAIRIQLTASR